MKSLMLFLKVVLEDLGDWCHTSTLRDLQTITHRVEHEGVSFLTITLADFGKEFERALDQGHVGNDQFCSFSRSGGLPRFLGGFLSLVFDAGTGRLLHEPNHTAIWAIRQLTLMWAKINLPCSDAREEAAFSKYMECELDVRASDHRLLRDPLRVNQFLRIKTLLLSDIFSKVNEDVYYGRVVPRHGPGATAERLQGNLKWLQLEWTSRLEKVFPHWEYLVSSERLIDRLDRVIIHEPEDERPVRVISVPKTLKTPRIIAIEPACMQYMQQGLLAKITEAIERNDTLSSLVGSHDQSPNQTLAELGSRDGTLATLDLSEASDRVSNLHVQLLLAHHRHLRDGVDACRSRKADVPGYGIIPLAKFASMGSALTFPFEAMTFLVIVFMGIEKVLSRQLTYKDVESFVGQVRIYGDDIIVPVEYVSSVAAELEAFGLIVNARKSFWTGKFRESCGKEYYSGSDVSIVKLRSMFPESRSYVSELVSTVSTRNQLYKLGMWKAADYLDVLIGNLVPFPHVEDTSPVLGRFSFLGYNSQKECPKLQSPLVKGAVVSSRPPTSQLDDYGAMLKVMSQGFNPKTDHLERSGRPRSVDTKIGWAQPY